MKLLGDCGYSRHDIQAILDSPIPYNKGEEEIRGLVEVRIIFRQETLLRMIRLLTFLTRLFFPA